MLLFSKNNEKKILSVTNTHYISITKWNQILKILLF